MKSPTRKHTLAAVIAIGIIFGCNLFIGVGHVTAAETDTIQFNVNSSMLENLVMLKGKTVTLYLTSGQTITGIVSDVRGNLLHLSKISQKEFYDALIAIDHISAIETKVR